MRTVIDPSHHLAGRLARVLVVSVPLVLACTASQALAQPPSGRLGGTDAQALSQALSQIGPMYEQMTQATIDGTLRAMERPENVERMAVFARRYYEALIKQGFSREEALQITAGAGSPAVRLGR